MWLEKPMPKGPVLLTQQSYPLLGLMKLSLEGEHPLLSLTEMLHHRWNVAANITGLRWISSSKGFDLKTQSLCTRFE